MLVDSIMRRTVVTIHPGATAREAARLMQEKRIGGIVVAEGGRPIGMLTERDLAWRVLAAARDPDRTQVREIMSHPLASIEPAAQVDAAAEAMKRLGVKRLVVVLDGQLRGIVTVTDIAYARPELSRQFVDTWVKPRWAED